MSCVWVSVIMCILSCCSAKASCTDTIDGRIMVTAPLSSGLSVRACDAVKSAVRSERLVRMLQVNLIFCHFVLGNFVP